MSNPTPARYTFHVLKWGGERPLVEYARMCISAGLPVVVQGPYGMSAGDLGRWEDERIMARIVRLASYDDVLAVRRVIGNPNRAQPEYPVYVVEALD